jgi:hypothetical protein
MSFDATALQALEAALSAPEGMEITEFLATLDEHARRDRAPADVQAYREGRKPWKKLADEVAPVAAFLRHAKIAGRIRFPLNDEPPDAWLLEDGSQTEVGIEVTRVLARSKHETAKSMQDHKVVPGFLGVADNAPSEVYKQVKARGRITKQPGGHRREDRGQRLGAASRQSRPQRVRPSCWSPRWGPCPTMIGGQCGSAGARRPNRPHSVGSFLWMI